MTLYVNGIANNFKGWDAKIPAFSFYLYSLPMIAKKEWVEMEIDK